MKNAVLLLPIMALLTWSCGNETNPVKLDENNRPIQPKFHSYENEGIWPDKAETHMPQIEKTGSNSLKVTVPLKGEKQPQHYIEVIVLMEGKRNQLAKKSIPFSFQPAEAEFKIDKPLNKNMWVVAKCNMHGMWRHNLNE